MCVAVLAGLHSCMEQSRGACCWLRAVPLQIHAFAWVWQSSDEVTSGTSASLVGLVMQSTGRGSCGVTCLNRRGPSFCGSPVMRPLYHWTLARRDVQGSSGIAAISLDCHSGVYLELSLN